ncbi:MAG TPA: hypothetical protein VFW83_02635 [Bryobacteraceae bacterium]|nr:hypothetical protein [Bryobacteraceae bacterium]
MKLSRAAIALYVGIVFASGGVLGFFANRLYTASTVSAKATKNPDDFRKNYVAEMQRRLQLSSDQVQRLNIALDESLGRFNDARSKMKQNLRDSYKLQVDQINAILTPAQQQEYAAMRKERQARQKQRQEQGQKKGRGRPGF